MRIYNKPELITALHGRLRQAGLMKGPVAYTDLLAFDQNHYRGVEAVEKCVTECQLGPNSNVIDIGSGIGLSNFPLNIFLNSTSQQVLEAPRDTLLEELGRTSLQWSCSVTSTPLRVS